MRSIAAAEESVSLSPASGARWLRGAIGIAAGAAATALAARVAVPLPGTPVPFTLQVLAVLLTGVFLGPGLGTASQVAYLLAGLAGLPMFAAGVGGAVVLFGPTGGYLLAFPVAAALAGVGAWKLGHWWGRAAMLAASIAAIHAGGAAWLSIIAGGHVAFREGVLPFVPGDLLKGLLAFFLATADGGRARRMFG